jgi:sugar lactone lactonase YvrE
LTEEEWTIRQHVLADTRKPNDVRIDPDGRVWAQMDWRNTDTGQLDYGWHFYGWAEDVLQWDREWPHVAA